MCAAKYRCFRFELINQMTINDDFTWSFRDADEKRNDHRANRIGDEWYRAHAIADS